jgi:hypothetical protein
MAMAEHTEGKIEIKQSSRGTNYCDIELASCHAPIALFVRKDQAEYIKLCWNTHDSLLAACEKALYAIKQRTLAHIVVDTRNAKFGLKDNYPVITKGEISAEKKLKAAIAAAGR